MITTLKRRWFSTGSSLIVKGTVSFFMGASFRARLGSVAGSEARFSLIFVPVIKICEGAGLLVLSPERSYCFVKI